MPPTVLLAHPLLFLHIRWYYARARASYRSRNRLVVREQ
jgi:hypothetical protein